MFGTHLGLADVTAASTDELLWIESVPCASIKVAPRLSSKVSLAALEADVVGVALHGKAGGVVEPSRPLRADGLALGQALVLEPHQSFLPHVLVKSLSGLNHIIGASLFNAMQRIEKIIILIGHFNLLLLPFSGLVWFLLVIC